MARLAEQKGHVWVGGGVVQPPGKRPSGLSVQAKLDVYLWFGACSDSAHMLDDLPAGYRPDTGGADGNSPPSYLLCTGE